MLGVENGGRNGIKMGIGVVWKTGVVWKMGVKMVWK